MNNDDLDLNMLSKYQAQTATAADAMLLPETMAHGAVAAVADFGTTVWNSLTPESMEVSTSDLLSRIDKDAMKVYEEHPDAIKTASFIGGVFVPAGLAFKGMTALRAGTKGVSWFSQAGETANLAKAAEAFKNSRGASEVLNQTKMSLYGAMAANAVVDNVAAEAAIVLAMNAHPYMEDYMDDLGSNFLLGAAIGSGIGATVGGIQTAYKVKNALQPIESGAYKLVNETAMAVPETMNLSDQLMVRSQNVKNWEATLKNSPALDQFTTSLLEYEITRNKAILLETFDSMAKGDLEKVSVETKNQIIDLMKDNVNFVKVDEISYWNKTNVGSPAEKTGLIQSGVNLVKKMVTPKGEEVTKRNAAVYFPEHQAFASLREAPDYTSLVDHVDKIEDLKTVNYVEFSTPRSGAALDLQILPAGEIEADYARALLFVEKSSVAELNKMAFHPDDLAMNKALLVKARSLPPEEQAKLSLTFSSAPPTWAQQQKLSIKSAGFSPDYLKGLKQLDANRKAFNLVDSKGGNYTSRVDKTLSKEAIELLDDWLVGGWGKEGGGSKLRKAATDYLGSTSGHGYFGAVDTSSVIHSMMNSENTLKLKEQLNMLADVDGNVLLYRGMRGSPKGHSAVESFSLSHSKAAHFAKGAEGELRLYKVHVDDIIGSIEDYGKSGKQSNSEILVLNRATRDSAVVSKTDPTHAPSKLFGAEGDLIVPEAVSSTGTKQVTKVEELLQQTSDLESKFAGMLQESGYLEESIAKRLGMDLGMYKTYGAGAATVKFSSELSVIEALNPANKALILNTNLKKVPFAELRSSIGAKNLDDMNSAIVEQVIHSSPDEFVRGAGEFIGTPEMRTQLKALVEGINEVTTTGLGNTMFRSANTVVERFGIAGTIATKIGADVTHYINQATEKLVKPISEAMGKVVAKESLIYEANLAMTVNASIKGPRIYRDGQFFTKVLDEATGKYVDEVVKYKGVEFRISSPEVLQLFDTFQTAGRSMYHLANSSHKILGTNQIADLGFWIPSFNPRNKEIAYVLEHTDGRPTTSILWAKTAGELNDKMNAFEKAAKAEGRNVTLLAKDRNFESFNKMKGREDELAMQVADVSMQHSGASANALISTNSELLTEAINSYDHLVAKGVRDLVDIQLAPVMDKLKAVSNMSQSLHNAKAMGTIQQALSQKKDPGQVMRNILLGKGLLSEHESWAKFQNSVQVGTDIALSTLAKITTPMLQKLGEKGGRNEATFIQFNKELEAAGLVPMKSADDFIRYSQEGKMVSETMTPRAVALFNATAATTLLRFMELAQPFVNMISMPILMSGAMQKQLGKSFLGEKLVGNPQFSLIAEIHEGIRLMNHPTEGARIMKLGADRGLFKSIVSEANEAMRHAKSLDPGLMAKGEALLESNFIKMMSKPADWSETMTRKMAFAIGYNMGKKAYPGLNDTGLVTFARSFMDEAIGNYVAAQRPAMFQGTVGVAMGIFQTYMFTLGQQLYRGIERGDWQAIAKQMFAQATVFGGSSLPGFHIVSEQIGAHYSYDHTDLTTGTIRAVGDDMGATLLYGLPASIGMGITTRGDIQPRIPNPIQGLDSLAAYNMTKQAWAAGTNIASAAWNVDESAGKAFVEALSVQSISRPIARLSELISGRSMTAAGNTIASNTTGNPFAEEFVLHGAIARVMATRPIEEVMARQAIQLDSVYKGVDGDKRRALTKRLKSHIQSGELDAETIQELQYQYLKTGSPSGWRSAVNDAMRQKVMGGNATVKDMFHPDAPYQRLVDDLG